MFELDRISQIPVYEQIINAIEKEILTGKLPVGAKLPSVRELAQILDTNPNTVQKSYTELDRRGVIVTVPSRGAFITSDAAKKIKARKSDLLAKINSLCAELCYAGISEETVIKEIKAAYALASNAIDLGDSASAFEANDAVSKKAPTAKKASAKKKPTQKTQVTKKPEPDKEEAEQTAKAPAPKRRLGIELL